MNIYISKRTLGMLLVMMIWLATVMIPVSLGHNKRINPDDAFTVIILLSPVAWFAFYQVMRRIDKLDETSESQYFDDRHLQDDVAAEYESIEDLIMMPKRKNR